MLIIKVCKLNFVLYFLNEIPYKYTFRKKKMFFEIKILIKNGSIF